jgi:anti-sigma-K factor RskA
VAEDRHIGVDERALDDAALEALAEAYAMPPRPELRARVLAAARREPRAGGRALVGWRLTGAAAAGLVLVLGGLLARESRRAATQATALAALARDNAELADRVAAEERTLAGLRDALAAQAQVLRVLGGPRTLTAALAPAAGGRGSGRVLVDATSGEAAVVLAGLGPAPAGKTYELWVIRGDRAPEPAGLLAAGDGPVAARAERVERPAEVTAFAVSIEPAGGSPSPTGPIVLAGAVAS